MSSKNGSSPVDWDQVARQKYSLMDRPKPTIVDKSLGERLLTMFIESDKNEDENDTSSIERMLSDVNSPYKDNPALLAGHLLAKALELDVPSASNSMYSLFSVYPTVEPYQNNLNEAAVGVNSNGIFITQEKGFIVTPNLGTISMWINRDASVRELANAIASLVQRYHLMLPRYSISKEEAEQMVESDEFSASPMLFVETQLLNRFGPQSSTCRGSHKLLEEEIENFLLNLSLIRFEDSEELHSKIKELMLEVPQRYADIEANIMDRFHVAIGKLGRNPYLR